MRFRAPIDLQNYQCTLGISDLKKKLEKSFSELGFRESGLFIIQYRKERMYLYAKCKIKNCRSQFRFKKNGEQSFQITKIKNEHIHNEKFDPVNHFFSTIPNGVQLSSIKKIAIDKFGLSAGSFYYRYKKYQASKIGIKSLNDLIKKLEKEDCEISLQPFPLELGKLPEILIVSTKKMKQLFKLFGDFVLFDLTYNMIKNRSQQNHQYAIGVVSGLNNLNKIIPYALVITSSESKQTFATIFQTILTTLGSFKTIITDQQNEMKSGVKLLQEKGLFSGTHSFDVFHLLRNLRKHIKDDEKIAKISKLFQEPNQQIFDSMVKDLREELNFREISAFERLLEKKQNCCLSQMGPQAFIPFCSSTSTNQKFNDIIKCRIPYQINYQVAVYKLIEVFEEVIQKSYKQCKYFNKNIFQLFDDNLLVSCHSSISSRIFQHFMKEYIQSLSLRYFEQSDNKMMIQSNFEREYVVQKIEDNIICNCYFSQKTGMCCRHQIIFCKHHSISYLQVINKRWIVDINKQSLKNRKIGRPRLSKRN